MKNSPASFFHYTNNHPLWRNLGKAPRISSPSAVKWQAKLAALFLLLFFQLAGLSQAIAEVVTASQDSYIKRGLANQNQGQEAVLRVRKVGKNRALVRFDQQGIENIVGSSSLQSATLRLYITLNRNNWGSFGRDVAVHRMQQDWDESSVTWNCASDTDLTNNQADCAQWAMQDSSQWPFSLAPTNVRVHQNNQMGWVEWDVTGDVAAFIAGSQANYGWVIKKVDEGFSGRVEYGSRQGGMYAPELVLVLGEPPAASGLPSVQDTFIKQRRVNKNHGGKTILKVRKAAKTRALVAFDQTGLIQQVGDRSVASAKLQTDIVYNKDNWGETGRAVTVHRMNQSWTEFGATWRCANDTNIENMSPDCPSATWSMSNASAWPFESTATDSVLHQNGQSGQVEWDVTADVIGFLNGDYPNFGWTIKKADESQTGYVRYASSESGIAPRLILTFVVQDTDQDGVSDASDQCPGTPAGESVDAVGCSTSQLDGDNDGVSDAADQCPNTPAGASVDVNGCALSQLDSDNDGVSDATDVCPLTPIGESVNAVGCSLSQLDSDNDGVSDAVDQCPTTPAGETVDANGCSASQLDEDGDGIADSLDQCAGTPAGEPIDAVGCSASQLDSDNDGVSDANDQCPGTPAGESVDSNGCSVFQLDTDSDGVLDAADQCPNTPTGEAVDAAGCSASQLDDDQDGISNAADLCPNTPTGESVDATGCSASQLDEDGDGVANSADLCPGTPLGETVDATGCSASQLDSDGDGVSDATDQCPGTLPGEGIDPEGCSTSQGGGPLPPDPATVAPSVDPTVVTTVYDATEFLYTGANPIQTGVVPGTIEPTRAAVLRGIVNDTAGNPLSGVKITILDHPELGQTRTRADGMFDLAVNGGGVLTVYYRKPGHLSVQRKLKPDWLTFGWLPTVVMMQLDSTVTSIDLTAATPLQTARGSVVEDTDGSRQATLLFSQGTQAELVLPDGSTQSVDQLNVRTTEYTVGPNGPLAMPGELPPASGYTYAVELSIDEALAVGAKEVRFSQPVKFYVENFIGFDTGSIVPVGYYDRDLAAWVPSNNGRVIEILAINGGLADIDIDGSGSVADVAALANLGIDQSELQELATLYSAGDSLWRVEVSHFTPWDLNWPWGVLTGAEEPNVPNAPNKDDDRQDDPCISNNSIVDCHNQAFGERIDVVGTPFALNYRSDRLPGRVSAYTLSIPITDASLPSNLDAVEVEITVAGRRLKERLAPLPSQTYEYVWDGLDAYGRRVFGNQPATVRIGYVYNAVYYGSTIVFASSFGAAGVGPIAGLGTRIELARWATLSASLGAWDSRLQGLGGWSLDVHHAYDPNSRVLYLGNGDRRTADRLPDIVVTVAGNGQTGADGIGGAATAAQLNNPRSIAVGPDGSFYIGEITNNRITRVDADGVISVVAGTGTAGFSGDGGLAINAEITGPNDVAVGPDGSLYIADSANHRIRRITPDGIIQSVAGSGETGAAGGGFSGDGGLATNALLNYPSAVEVASDGTLYIIDGIAHMIRRVMPDGVINTIRDVGESSNISALALAPDGTLYFSDTAISNRIVKISPSGKSDFVANRNSNLGFGGDGVPAIDSAMETIHGLEVGDDGTLYVAASFNWRVRKISPDGIITTIAGDGTFPFNFNGDGLAATQTSLSSVFDLALAPDGNLLFTDVQHQRIRKIAPSLPGSSLTEITIADEDGDEIYIFSGKGKHLRTVDSLTGAVLYSFSYDANNYLNEIIDTDGNTYQITRLADGTPNAIVSPDGQVTSLTVNGIDDFLTGLTNPAGESYSATYTADGLMTSFTDPRGGSATMSYFPDGRLERDTNPAGGFLDLVQILTATGYYVDKVTGEDRATNYLVDNQPTGDRLRINTLPDGTISQFLLGVDGTSTFTSPDGTVTVLEEGPDPRFGLQAPILTREVVTTPGGLVSDTTATRTVTLNDPTDLFSINTLIDTVTVNGRVFTSTYDGTNRTELVTTPGGRQTMRVLDVKGRTVQQQTLGLNETAFVYDNRGRLTDMIQGTGADQRSTAVAYGADGFVSSIIDALNRSVLLVYDNAGRVTQQTFADGNVVQYSYDANGNVSTITPPGQPIHQFQYTPINLESEYDPPDVSAGNDRTTYFYNLDKQLTQIVRPDGGALDYAYNTGGQLTTLTIPSGVYGYSYNASTGNVSGISAPGNSALAFTFDGSLLLTETWTGDVAGTVSRTYDNNFRINSRSVNGSTVSHAYDNDSLLTQAGQLTLTRDMQTGLVSATSLGDVSTSRSYNGFGEALQESASYNGTAQFDVSYVRDKLGRITDKTETIGGLTSNYQYAYDPKGRLEQVSKDSVIVSTYSYDANGNRLTHVTPSKTTSGSYDDQDRLTSYGDFSYSYTANGELLSKTNTLSSETTNYTYDVLGNLIAVQLPDGTDIQYVIDGQNRRIGKKVNGALSQGFLYQDQLSPIAELDGSNNVVARFIYGEKTNVPDYMQKGGTTYRIVSDHLGSPRLVINIADGTVTQRVDYDEFGNVINDTNPGFQPFGFAGGIYDQDTKLVRFGARDYDAIVGSWTAKDPIHFSDGEFNLYTYVSNNPIHFLDPFGLGSQFSVFLKNVGRVSGGAARNPGVQILANDFSNMLAACKVSGQDILCFLDNGSPNVQSVTSSNNIGGQCPLPRDNISPLKFIPISDPIGNPINLPAIPDIRPFPTAQ